MRLLSGVACAGVNKPHSHRAVPESDALAAVRELFHVAYWFGRTYGRTERPAPGLAFNSVALPRPAEAAKHTHSLCELCVGFFAYFAVKGFSALEGEAYP